MTDPNAVTIGQLLDLLAGVPDGAALVLELGTSGLGDVLLVLARGEVAAAVRRAVAESSDVVRETTFGLSPAPRAPRGMA